MNPRSPDACGLRDALEAGAVSEAEALAAYADAPDPHGAFLTRIAPAPAGSGPLRGVPFALKANLAARGVATSCGSALLAEYRSPFEATVVTRLRDAGAVLVGSTNMDEFGMGSSGENSAFGPTRNPFDPARTPGGSSGGSAVAVAAHLAAFALGSDTGGSVRQPAGFCGVVGYKPSYGRVSRYGLVAFGSSLDQIGPITRSVRDAAWLHDLLAGPDPRDATTLPTPPPDATAGLDSRPVDGLRIGVPWSLLGEGLDDDVREDFEDTLARLAREGAEVVDVDLPTMDAAISAYYVVATAEASSNLARFDGILYGQREAASTLPDTVAASRTRGLGPEVKRRILLGTFVLSAGYYDAYMRRAAKVRRKLLDEHLAALTTCDVLATPTSPSVAFPLGERTDDPLRMYLSDVFTVGANLTGLPALAQPTTLDDAGLPRSLQFTAGPGRDAELLAASHAVERVLDFRGRYAERLPLAREGGA